MKINLDKDQVIVICIIVLGFLLAAATAHAQSVPDVECPEGYICTWSGSDGSVNTTGEMTTTVISPSPTAVSPQFSAGNGNDLCTVGIAGAVQTQILGLSAGKTVRDMNCERLKNAKALYDMGMKVAAVSTMCQDERVRNGGTLYVCGGNTTRCRCRGRAYSVNGKTVTEAVTKYGADWHILTTHVWGVTKIDVTYYTAKVADYFAPHTDRIRCVAGATQNRVTSHPPSFADRGGDAVDVPM